MQPFREHFVVPDFAGGAVIRRVNNDTWAIDDEYVTMIEAPNGFWTDAFLDARQ